MGGKKGSVNRNSAVQECTESWNAIATISRACSEMYRRALNIQHLPGASTPRRCQQFFWSTSLADATANFNVATSLHSQSEASLLILDEVQGKLWKAFCWEKATMNCPQSCKPWIIFNTCRSNLQRLLRLRGDCKKHLLNCLHFAWVLGVLEL
jgi:hypothetical protein